MDSSKRLHGLLSMGGQQHQAKTLDSNREDTSDAGFMKETSIMGINSQNFS